MSEQNDQNEHNEQSKQNEQGKESRRPQIVLTRNLRIPNEYTLALDGECRDFAYNEERAPGFKAKWRSEAFKVEDSTPMHLEIGTGNGKHFQHQVLKNPNDCFVGVELKYKPLIQTIRGVLRKEANNARVCRYHAFNIDQLFAPDEINNIFIHFPDPWVTPRKPRNRFVNRNVLTWLHAMQREGSVLEFKTDSREYFLWALEEIQNTPYKLIFKTLDLHNSEKDKDNFRTQFENIFTKQGIPINYLQLQK